MERIVKRNIGDYTLTATAYDAAGTLVPISSPGTCIVYDSAGTEIHSGTPAVSSGVLSLVVDNADLASIGTYVVVWTGTAASIAYEWETLFELVEDTAPDFDTYSALGGSLTEARFNELKPNAQAEVDAAIWPNEVTTTTRAAYERAICGVIESLSAPQVTSESVGNTSVTYAQAPTPGSVITKYLAGTGLLYRGI